MKALRAFVAVSALGWLAFAVLVSASTPEPPAPDVDASLALGEAGALRVAPPSAPLPPAEQLIVVSQDTSAQ